MGHEKKLGPEIIDEIVKDPSLDVWLDRNPHQLAYSDEELMRRIEVERKNRAMFIEKGSK